MFFLRVNMDLLAKFLVSTSNKGFSSPHIFPNWFSKIETWHFVWKYENQRFLGAITMYLCSLQLNNTSYNWTLVIGFPPRPWSGFSSICTKNIGESLASFSASRQSTKVQKSTNKISEKIFTIRFYQKSLEIPLILWMFWVVFNKP